MSISAFESLPDEKKGSILSEGIREFSAKSYSEASTEAVTRNAGISKGLLFHYFGSKKTFYLYCLDKSMECLVRSSSELSGDDFHSVFFNFMERKMALCMEHPDEMHMVNMASRESAAEISVEKNALIGKYMLYVKSESDGIMKKAVSFLKLREGLSDGYADALSLYASAVINRYLTAFQEDPDAFFSKREQIREEIRNYLDFMLYGVCNREE
ncbi:MAG: TetR/AcrR family transcriptional regulator [Oscillospiraceae bacterium]|nr:TetR/AcrR family transcriptional regulator [Oscillospiraceae bacterium]